MMNLIVSNTNKINEDGSSSEQKKTQFSDLNEDCLRMIIGFLENSDQLGLFPCCRMLYGFKRDLHYFYLNAEYSKKYYIDPEFRNLIKSKVSDISKQISVNLSYLDDITDVSALGGVHTLNLSCCNRITDVSALGGVHNLKLQQLYKN